MLADDVRLLIMWPSHRPTPPAYIEAAKTVAAFSRTVGELVWQREVIRHRGIDLDHLSVGGPLDGGGRLLRPGTYLRIAEAAGGDAFAFAEILHSDGSRELHHPLRAGSVEEARRLLELWSALRDNGAPLSRFREPADPSRSGDQGPDHRHPSGDLDQIGSTWLDPVNGYGLTLVRADEFVLKSPDGRRIATFDNAATAELFASAHVAGLCLLQPDDDLSRRPEAFTEESTIESEGPSP
jgi:hypothetical protein